VHRYALFGIFTRNRVGKTGGRDDRLLGIVIRNKATPNSEYALELAT
jgi:hypothetical protein